MKIKDTTFDKIQSHLFFDESELIHLNKSEIEILNRYKEVFTIWLENPSYSDKQIVNYMHFELGLSKSQAYRDLPRLKLLLGNVQNANKEWYRYMVIEMCKDAFSLAKKKRDPKAMSLAADKIGKYTKLDKDEAEALPWEDIIPPSFEPAADIRLLDMKPIENIENLKQKLRQKYMDEVSIDTEFSNVEG